MGFIKVQRVSKVQIKFNKKSLAKAIQDMFKKLRRKAKTDFEKEFLKLKNNAFFGKTMENVRKLMTTKRRSNYLVPKRTDHAQKFFPDRFNK